jgi:peptidyl-tRNA hydrolase
MKKKYNFGVVDLDKVVSISKIKTHEWSNSIELKFKIYFESTIMKVSKTFKNINGKKFIAFNQQYENLINDYLNNE